MAKTVYDQEEVKLQDGTEVRLAPLPIGKLRRFMKAWQEIGGMDSEDDAFDVYINCSGIALSNKFNEKFDKTLDSETYITEEYREYLEDVLDLETIFKILEVCGGLKLNDPKLLEAAEEAARQQMAAGTN